MLNSSKWFQIYTSTLQTLLNATVSNSETLTGEDILRICSAIVYLAGNVADSTMEEYKKRFKAEIDEEENVSD